MTASRSNEWLKCDPCNNGEAQQTLQQDGVDGAEGCTDTHRVPGLCWGPKVSRAFVRLGFWANDASRLRTSQIVVDLLFTLQLHLKMKTSVFTVNALKIPLNVLQNFMSSNRMQFSYQIKSLFVFCAVCHYGNFTVYQLQWSPLNWEATSVSYFLPPPLRPQPSWSPFYEC